MSHDIDPELDRRLEREAADLSREFAGVFDPATVRRHVYVALEMLPEPKILNFRHVFARRFARELLQSAARWKGIIPMTKPQVLFVCVHNAGRSQMAAAFTKELSERRVDVLSAGSTPAESVNPQVFAAMKEVGIDLSESFPKLLSDDFVRASDVVITMGCGDACPVFPGKRYEDWQLDDPAGKGLPAVRAIRDAIRQRVVALLASLETPRQAVSKGET